MPTPVLLIGDHSNRSPATGWSSQLRHTSLWCLPQLQAYAMVYLHVSEIWNSRGTLVICTGWGSVCLSMQGNLQDSACFPAAEEMGCFVVVSLLSPQE